MKNNIKRLNLEYVFRWLYIEFSHFGANTLHNILKWSEGSIFKTLKNSGPFLKDNLKKNRVVKSKQLLKLKYAQEGHKKILFTDEDFSKVEHDFNKLNNPIYAQSSIK